MTREEIRGDVRQFLLDHFTLDSTRTLLDDESFLGSGAIDSAGIIRLIALLEQRFKIEVQDNEMVAENFDSVLQAGEFIFKKLINEPSSTNDRNRAE